MEKGDTAVKNVCPNSEVLSLYYDSEKIGDEALHIRNCLDCQRYLKELSELDRLLLVPSSTSQDRPSRQPTRRIFYPAAVLAILAGLLWHPDSAGTRHSVVTTAGRKYRVATNAETHLLSLEINGQEVMRNEE